MKITSRQMVAGLAGALLAAAPAAALAQDAAANAVSSAEVRTGVGNVLRLGARADATTSVRTTGAEASTSRVARGEQRAEKAERLSGAAIDARISSLTKLSDRIAGMKLLSSTDEAAVQASITAGISSLTDLKAKLASGESAEDAKADLSSIRKSYRVYLLVVPQAAIIAGADRALAVAAQMQQLSSKFAARIDEAGATSEAAAAKASFDVHVANAASEANAAIDLVAGLKADGGDQAALKANTATLKAARAKLQAAQQDLRAARQDASGLLGVVAGRGARAGASASAGAGAEN